MSCFSVLFSFFRKTDTVNGVSYSVIKRIGEGGFSYVDLVSKGNSQYALKRMLLQVPEQKEAVESEVRVHGMIRHRNVIRLIDSEIKDGYRGDATAFLVFPYYKNGTLQDLMDHVYRTGVPLEEQQILELFISACRGLHAMHTCKNGPLAHNDIKPGNLLLSDNGEELILMDLGSARNAQVPIANRQQALAFQELCAQTCTSHYRAPELFEVPSSCTITAKTDIWSLGCSVYAAAFGKSPCDGSALAANSGRIVFPRTHNYSEEFCTLILWILNVTPDSRPTANEVQLRLEALLEELVGTP